MFSLVTKGSWPYHKKYKWRYYLHCLLAFLQDAPTFAAQFFRLIDVKIKKSRTHHNGQNPAFVSSLVL